MENENKDPKSQARREDVRSKLNPHPLVERMVQDPSQPPNVRALTGLLGKSSRPGYIRLYLADGQGAPAFNEYVDIREEDIANVEPASSESGAQARSMLWIDSEARLQHTRVSSRQVQADFLQGDLSRTFLGAAGLQRLMAQFAPELQPGPSVDPAAAKRLTTNNACIASAIVTLITVTIVATGPTVATVTVVA